MRVSQNPMDGYWTLVGGKNLRNVHHPTDCAGRGCAIHNHPSQHNLVDATVVAESLLRINNTA